MEFVEDNNRGVMAHTMDLTYIETVDLLDVNYIVASTTRYTLTPGKIETSDLNFVL